MHALHAILFKHATYPRYAPATRVHRLIGCDTTAHVVNATEQLILDYLDEHPTATPSQVARGTGLKMTTTHAAYRRLVNKWRGNPPRLGGGWIAHEKQFTYCELHL